jgi:hypothetical protein
MLGPRAYRGSKSPVFISLTACTGIHTTTPKKENATCSLTCTRSARSNNKRSDKCDVSFDPVEPRKAAEVPGRLSRALADLGRICVIQLLIHFGEEERGVSALAQTATWVLTVVVEPLIRQLQFARRCLFVAMPRCLLEYPSSDLRRGSV